MSNNKKKLHALSATVAGSVVYFPRGNTEKILGETLTYFLKH